MSTVVQPESLQTHINHVKAVLPFEFSVPTMGPMDVHQCEAQAEVSVLKGEVNALKTDVAQLRNELGELKKSRHSPVALVEKVAPSSEVQTIPPTQAIFTTAHSYIDTIPTPWAPADYDMENHCTNEDSNDKGESSAVSEPAPLPQHTPFIASNTIQITSKNSQGKPIEAQYLEEQKYIALAEILHCCNKKAKSEMTDKALRDFMKVYANRSFDGLEEIKAYCEAARKVCDIEIKYTKKAFHIRLKDRMKPFKSDAFNVIFFRKRDFTIIKTIHAEYIKALTKKQKMQSKAKLAKKAAGQKVKLG